ncbi:MAG TPA: mechanosensitive ion channel [Gammaproteobacteria bacterium]|nr:mechanosensitive ion channel [Gammaproteobacteria bacterium]
MFEPGGLRLLSRLLFCLLLAPVFLLAAETPGESDYAELQQAYDQIESAFSRLDPDHASASDLDALNLKITALTGDLENCIEANTKALASAKKNLELLGDKQSSEDPDIRDKRRELNRQFKAIDNDLKRCTVLNIQTTEIGDKLQSLRQQRLRKQFFSREFSVISAIERFLTFDEEKLQREFDPIRPVAGKVASGVSWPLLLMGLAGLAIGGLWRRSRHYTDLQQHPHSSDTLLASAIGLQRTSPILAALALIDLLVLLQSPDQTLMVRFIGYAFLLFFTYGLARGVMFPDPRAIANSRLPVHLLRVLTWVAILFTLATFFLNQETAGRYSGSAILYLLWLGSLTIAALAFIVLIWAVARKLSIRYQRLPSTLLLPAAVLLGAVAAGALGYRNIASLFFFGAINSFIVVFFAFLLVVISAEFFDALDEGRVAWQSKLRHLLAIKPGRPFPGVLWLRILAFFAVALASIVALMFVWGSTHQRISALLVGLKEGIKFGSFNLDLINLIYALLILVGVFSALPFVKNQLVAGWLKHSSLSRGAREATQTLVGYGGAAIAVLWALSVAGVNFQNLAIVAGALSVGIGFGLQNIVNNFVSGLILLFERPIRRGDWIVVGDTEGHVKDISIRSTTIQTFDRADVIVPNSELISNQVTNWVLSNTIGRLRIPIGVAYGSDLDQVMTLLEKVAHDHPDVISDSERFPIRVLFREFGDSALLFELRCFARNIDDRLIIQSALNLAIDREFRKAGIEIPFPQRVVYLHRETNSPDDMDEPDKPDPE